MEVRCDKCQARYKVDDARIGPQGLTMRCGKCQNTFKVTKPEGAAAAPAGAPPPAASAPPAPAPKPSTPAAPKPAAKPVSDSPATMMFAGPVGGKPAAPPAAPAKPAAAPKAAPVKAAPAAASDEGAGRTMMFNTGSIKTAPSMKAPPKPAEPESNATMVFGQAPVAKPLAPAAKPPPKPAEGDSGATMVFGQSPVAPPSAPAMPSASAPAAAKAPLKAPAKAADDAAGATMMFVAAPAVAAKPAVKPAPPPPAPPPPAAEPEQPEESEAAAEAPASSEAETEEEAAAAIAAETGPVPPVEHDEQAEALTSQSEPADDPRARPQPDNAHDHRHGGVEAEGAESSEGGAESSDASTFDKAPPKGLLIGVAAGLAALLLLGGGLVAMKKMGKRAPPPAALEALAAVQGAADKDSAVSLADAEKQVRDAQDAAGPKAYFPQGTAALAEIQVQEADANTELAALWTDQASRAGDAGNDAKKAEAEAKAAELQGKAKAQLQAAFELVKAAIKADQKSPDLELALADYYRAQKSSSNMNKELKKAQALKADESRVALIQALSTAQEEDGAEKAVPKLKALLAQNPQSARLHFKLALAHQQLKDDASMKKELADTLKLSPQHERAKLLQELSAGDQK